MKDEPTHDAAEGVSSRAALGNRPPAPELLWMACLALGALLVVGAASDLYSFQVRTQGFDTSDVHSVAYGRLLEAMASLQGRFGTPMTVAGLLSLPVGVALLIAGLRLRRGRRARAALLALGGSAGALLLEGATCWARWQLLHGGFEATLAFVDDLVTDMGPFGGYASIAVRASALGGFAFAVAIWLAKMALCAGTFGFLIGRHGRRLWTERQDAERAAPP